MRMKSHYNLEISMYKLSLLLSLLFFWLAGRSVSAQSQTLQNDGPDSTIQVVAYFCKGDSMVYNYNTRKWKVSQGDTTVSHAFSEKFLLVVEDSTADGYKIAYTPLDYTFPVDSQGSKRILFEALWSVTKNLRPVFLTDEFGEIKHLSNWCEIRDGIRKGIGLAFDSIYMREPGLDSVMPRKRLSSIVLLKYSNEEGVISAYEEMGMLFGLHGNELTIGVADSQDSTAYAARTRLLAGYEPADDSDAHFEGNYMLQVSTVTTLSNDEAQDLLGSVFNMLLTDSVAGKVNAVLADSIAGSLVIRDLIDFHYFYNGWPRLMRKQRVAELMDYKTVDETTIEWSTYHWKPTDRSAEEPKRTF